jgi:CHAT domain-containing protein
MSIWKLPDKQTRKLKVDFYQGLKGVLGRGEALRKAQLEMKKEYPNPLYWGAFVCQGNPGPLSHLPLHPNS